MMTSKHIFSLTIVILLTLLLRDLPYFNVIYINRIWLLYLTILLIVLLSNVRFKISRLRNVTVLLFFASYILTLSGLLFFAEALGTLIYFSLWTFLAAAFVSYLKGTG